jgi:hypothetical protein
MVHAMFDRHAQRERLALAGYDHDDLARIKDGLYAHRKRHAWYGGDVVAKEARIREDCVVSERLEARARRQRGPGLVERDVPVLADAPEEELDAAHGLDLLLVLVALFNQVWRVPIKDVYVFRVDIHWASWHVVSSPPHRYERGAGVNLKGHAHREKRTPGT